MVKEYKLADSSPSKFIKILKAISVYAVEEDRMVSPIESSLTRAEKAEDLLSAINSPVSWGSLL